MICESSYTVIVKTSGFFLSHNVTESLRVTLTPKKLKTGIGSTVILSCSISGSPGYHVQWYRNIEPVTADEFISIRGTDNETLVISSAQKIHSGAYQCFGSRKTQTVQDFAIVVLEGKTMTSTTTQKDKNMLLKVKNIL